MKKMEKQGEENNADLRETARKWCALVENIPDPISRFDLDLKFNYVNSEFLRISGKQKHEIIGKRSEEVFSEEKWTGLWVKFLLHVLDTGKANEMEIHYKGGYMCTKVVPEFDEQGVMQSLLTIGRDMTEQKRAEKLLKKNSHEIHRIVETVPHMISVMKLDTKEISYLNTKRFDSHGYDPDIMQQKSRIELEHLVHEDDRLLLREYFESAKMLSDQDVVRVEYRAVNLNGHWQWFHATGKVFQRNEKGEVTHIVNLVENVTARKEAEQEILRLKDETTSKALERYRMLFNSMDQGYCIIQMLYNKEGEPYDWRFTEVNPAFERHNGLTHATGKTILELVPDIEPKWMKIYGAVAETGISVRFEESSEALHRAFDLFAYRIGKPEEHRVAVLFTDITERKQAELSLRESEARLSALVSAVPTAISLVDLEGKLVYSNKEMQHYIPFGMLPTRDDENHWRWQAWDKDGDFVDRENYPGAQALRGETVVPGMEMLFTHGDGTKTWTRVSAVPVKSSDDRILGTVSVITDIDELKRTAEALINSSQQLALSLDAAKMGTFEWNSDDAKLKLSQSSSEIYGLNEHEPILSNEEAYKLVHFEDIEMRKSVFEQPGVLAAYYHEYRIIKPLDGKMAWIAEKGKAYRDSFTGITTIRGVHWDITEKKKIEEALRSSERNLKELNENLEQQVQKRTKELMKLKLDQEKEKLNAIIFTQEQERARISEGLHDGVAQLLYAVQNRLQMIKSDGAGEDKEFKIAKEILTEAIEDTRKISFELMPPVLKDYGLEVCLKTLLKKIVGDRLNLNWDVNIVGRLPDQLEITIYRIVQEILNNTLKHAKATEAGLSIKVADKYVRLRAYDNGVGFSVKKTKAEYRGIGLQSIRNRVKLLNGKMQINSILNEGTVIELQLPLIQK